MLETLSQALRRLAAAGFTEDLLADGTTLRAVPSQRRFTPAQLVIAEIVRFEGETDPDDEAILFALTNTSGEPVGTYAVPYGPSASPEEDAIARELH